MRGTSNRCLRPPRAMAAMVLMAPLLVAALPGGTAAQTAPGEAPTRSRFSGSLALLNTQPLGALATGPGLGVAAAGAFALDAARIFRVRAELRAAGYGSEERRACLGGEIGCLIELEVDTRYTSFYLGAGPEVALGVLGTELVLDATAGIGAFAVTSSVRGVSEPDRENRLDTDNFRDEFFAWSVGGELRIPVASRFAVTVGSHYQHNGEASYVPEGGVTQNGDGSLAIDARTTDANLVTLTLGVAFRPFTGSSGGL
jgi:hypothetical protein